MVRRRLLTGAAWAALAATCTQGGVFLAHLAVANVIGQAAFGKFSIVANTIGMLSGVASLAMGLTTTKYVAQYRATDPDHAGRVIRSSANLTRWTAAIGALVLFLGSSYVARAVLGAPELAVALAISSIGVFFTVLAAVPFGTLSGLEAFDRIAVAGIVYAGLYVFVTPVMAFAYGVNGAVVGIAVASLLRWTVVSRSMREQMDRYAIPRSGSVSNPRDRRVIMHFAIPAAATGLITLPSLWAAQAILAAQSSGFSQLALFSAALAIKNVVVFLPGLLNSVATAVLNNAWGQDDSRGFRHVFRSNMALNVGLLVAVGIVVVVFSSEILGLYGPGFEQARPLLLIMMIAALLEGVSSAMYQVIQSQERMWASFFGIALPRDALVVVLALWLVPGQGGMGLAAAYTGAMALGCLATCLMALRLQPELFRRRANYGALP